MSLMRLVLAVQLLTSGVVSSTLTTVVTKGAFLQEIPDITVYTDSEIILEPLTDIPTLKNPVDYFCENCSTFFQNFTRPNHEIINTTQQLLDLMSQVFSFRGVDYSKHDVLHKLNFGRYLHTDQEDDSEPMPKEDEIDSIGRDIYALIQSKIKSRELNEKEVENIVGSKLVRQRRFVGPLVSVAYPLVRHLGKNIFLPKHGLYKLLINLASGKPTSLLNFANSPNLISSLAAKSMKGLKKIITLEDKSFHAGTNWQSQQKEYGNLSGVIYSTGLSVNHFNKDNGYEYAMRQISQAFAIIKSIMEAIIETNLLLGESVFMTHLLTQQLLQFNALQACRDGTIPPTFLPPSLLKRRLTDLLEVLPQDMELAVPLTDIQKLYTLKNTKCYFDVDGGMMEVTVPSKRRDEEFKMFHMQSIYYAWFNKTCSISIESGYLAQETQSGTIYPIRREVGSQCQPLEDSMCLVNRVTTSGWEEELCVRVMLEGGSAEEVEEACKLRCILSSRLISTQLDEVTFIMAHLPYNGTVIECPGFVDKVFSHTQDRGAFRLSLAPSCAVRVNGKIVARATRKPNVRVDAKVMIQHLIPSHWTHLEEWIAFDQKSTAEISFKNISGILDSGWKDSVGFTYVSDIITIPNIIGAVWTFVHSVGILYLFFRMNALPFIILNEVNNAHALPVGSCNIDDDLYTYIYVMIGLLLSIVCPKAASVVVGKIKTLWSYNVKRAAVSQLQTAKPAGVIVANN